jgi:hypothetical protein
MAIYTIERRRAELYALKLSNPAQLIAIYRHFSGLDECQQLPRNVSYFAMIELILDVQEQERQIVAEHAELEQSNAMA